MNLLRLGALFIAALFLTGCLASHPLGISSDVWETMTEEQRVEAYEKQSVIDEQRRQERLAREERERQEALRMEKKRAEAGFGELVQCTLTGGQLHRRGDWRPAQSSGIEVLRGETRTWTLHEQDRPSSRRSVNIHFDGVNVQVCNTSGSNCDNLAASQRQMQRGATQRISVDRHIRGPLTCTLAGKTTRAIIQLD